MKTPACFLALAATAALAGCGRTPDREPAAAAAAPAVAAAAPATAEVTFCRDVAPILFARCAECHRPGEVAPFPLLTYKDAAKRAAHLKEVTAARRMPPWLPEPGPHAFIGDRRLTDRELEVLAKWADAGAPEGNPADLPPPPSFPDGWQLGKPDLVLTVPRPYRVPADGADPHQVFVLPIPGDGLRWIKGFQFRPGNRRVVHHVNVLLDTTGDLRRRAEKEDGPGFRTQAGAEAFSVATGTLGIGWRPGTSPRFFREGESRPVRPGTDLVLVVHYHPTGKPEEDQSSIGLYFTDKPSERQVFEMRLTVAPARGNQKMLDIPAGTKRHKVSLTGTTPVNFVLDRVTTHAHCLMTEMSLTATPPGGKTFPLLEIKNWDFNQQDLYHYVTPFKLPEGTRIDLVGYFDNSADNPQNPSSPPKDVRYGEGTTDEMFAGVLLVYPDGEEARAKYREFMARRPRPKGARAENTVPVLPADDGKGLRLPPGGYRIPADALLLRERYDADKDGVLSQAELEAIPQPGRGQIEERIRRRAAIDAGASKGGPPKKSPPPAGKTGPEALTVPPRAKE